MKHQNYGSGRGVRRSLLLLAGALALSACGDNLFETGNPPELNSFEPSSTSVAEGDTVRFTVDADGPRTIDRVRVSVTGAMTLDTTFAVEEPGTQVTGFVDLPIPEGTTGPQITATAWAIDVAPDTSESRSATVQISDNTPPSATVVVTPSQATEGEQVTISVTGQDNRGLAQIGAIVWESETSADTLVHAVSGAPQASHDFSYTTPSLDTPELLITPFARDVSDFYAEGEPGTLALGDQQGPAFLSLETSPDSTIPLQDSLQVTVELEDPAGIQRVTFIGLAYRGVPSMGTDSVVERFTRKTIELPRPTEGDTLPKRYTLNPYLFTDDFETTEPLEVFVIAEDGLGNVSDTTKLMYVGGPDVTLVYPPEDFAVGVGDNFDVRILVEDGTGIDSVHLVESGLRNQTTPLPVPTRTDTPFVLVHNITMPSAEGTLSLQARAWNPSEVSGQTRTVAVEVMQEPPSDTMAPIVSVRTERLVPTNADDRMELLDELRVTVSAFDGNAGLARIGLMALVSWAESSDTVRVDQTFAGSKSLEELVFQIPVDSLFTLLGVTDEAQLDSILPENLDLRFHGFAADTVGNFACAVGVDEQRDCTPASYTAGGFYEAADTSGALLEIQAVRGVTILLDNREAEIADLAVDTLDDRLFLSNKSENLVEFLELETDFRDILFHDPVQVGSEPLGIFIGERIVAASEPGFVSTPAGSAARTLIVGNSGGTNMSLVNLESNAASVQEVDVVRLQTDNAVLYEIKEEIDEFGNIRFLIEYYDFSDRPQYLAQDSLLRIVYSTVPTIAAPTATVRFAHSDPDPTSATDEPEVRFLLTGDMVDTEAGESLVLANVDSLQVQPISGGDDFIRVFTHEPGYPDNVIVSGWYNQLADAVSEVSAQINSVMALRPNAAEAPVFLPFFLPGTWDLEELGWSDQTFVSASGDRGKIVLGEGQSQPTGRIMMWHGDATPDLSDEIQIADLVNNAAEEVLGVGLNQTGTLGVARGREATYFFSPDLRLLGQRANTSSGGAGAALHPEHDELTDGQHLSSDGAGVAFTGTAQHSIDVVNTFHFNPVNELIIRDDIVGPLVSGPPLASDNGGQGGQCVALAATEAARKDCIVAKLYGITTAGGVVVVNVRWRDLEPDAMP